MLGTILCQVYLCPPAKSVDLNVQNEWHPWKTYKTLVIEGTIESNFPFEGKSQEARESMQGAHWHIALWGGNSGFVTPKSSVSSSTHVCPIPHWVSCKWHWTRVAIPGLEIRLCCSSDVWFEVNPDCLEGPVCQPVKQGFEFDISRFTSTFYVKL